MDTVVMNNSTPDLIKYFSVEHKPCSVSEFKIFWSSLTDGEKTYFRTARLI